MIDRSERLNDPEESLRLAIEGNQAKVWTAIPCIVSAVDLSKQTVSCQPAIKGEIGLPDGSSKQVNLPLLVDVPICWPRAGGFALTFPVAVNDEVLVVFASRCIDSWWQNGGVGVAAEVRMHDLSDGFAILAPTSQPKKLSGVSSSNVQLRDEAGTTFLEIDKTGKVKITAVAEIDLTAPAIKMTGAIEIVGAVNQTTGGITSVGSVQALGVTAATVSGTTSVSSGGKNFNTHTHGGVQTGTGSTGVPN